MGTLDLEGDAKFSKGVESLAGEEVDEEFAACRVILLFRQPVALVEAEDAPLDEAAQDLRLGRVDLLAQNTFVTVKETGDALARHAG